MQTKSPIRQTNIALDPQAREYLEGVCAHPRLYGRYLSKLLHEDKLRKQYEAELARIKEERAHAPAQSV
jgi:hypothetical protein